MQQAVERCSLLRHTSRSIFSLFQTRGESPVLIEAQMKTRLLVLVLVITGFGAIGVGEDVSPSPASLHIAAAQKVLQKQPNRYQAENDLAMALIRRARETGDSSYYQQADA